jgi:hypothetical protein
LILTSIFNKWTLFSAAFLLLPPTHKDKDRHHDSRQRKAV